MNNGLGLFTDINDAHSARCLSYWRSERAAPAASARTCLLALNKQNSAAAARVAIAPSPSAHFISLCCTPPHRTKRSNAYALYHTSHLLARTAAQRAGWRSAAAARGGAYAHHKAHYTAYRATSGLSSEHIGAGLALKAAAQKIAALRQQTGASLYS